MRRERIGMTAVIGARAGLRARADLMRVLVERQLRLRSKRAVIGTVWPAVSPMVMLALYSFVFNRVFTVPVERYPEFLLAGLLPWSFLSQSVSASISTLSADADLIRRAPFRHAFIPISMVLSMAVYFVTTLVGFCAYLAYHGRLEWTLAPALLVPAVAVVLFVAGLAQLVAVFDVYNRDLRWVVGNALTIWFFLLPIVYQHQMAPESLQFLRSVDPMNLIIGQFRDILYYRSISRPEHFALMFLLCLAFFAACRGLFSLVGRDLPKDV